MPNALLLAAAVSASSGFVPVLEPGNVFSPLPSSASGAASESVVDCPDVFEAAYVGDFAVDGDVSKSVWKKAKPVTAFAVARSPGKPMSERAEVRVLYSPTALYVGGTFFQPMATMTARYDQHDKPVYDDDCLEMLLFVPGERGADLYHWAFNAIGACYDSRNDKKTYWTKGLSVKTRRFDDRWTLEVRLPFEGVPLERPIAGDFLGLRFCRRVNSPRSTGAVPYLRQSGNNQRANFGKLVFTASKGDMPEGLVAEARRYRKNKEVERLRKRLADVCASVRAQEGALAAWGDCGHPAVLKARQGVGQMRTALEKFERRNGEALKRGTDVDAAEVRSFFELAAGFAKFVSDNAYVVWQTSPWENGDPEATPAKQGWGRNPIEFRQAGNEREAVCLCLAGLLCGPRLDVRIVPHGVAKGKGSSFLAAEKFEVYHEPYVRVDGELMTAPLVRADGNLFTLTPAHATRVWLMLNSSGVTPGTYRTSVEIKPSVDVSVARRSIPVTAQVWNFELPATRDWPIKSFFWGPDTLPNDEVQALTLMHGYHVTHGWTKSKLYGMGITPDGRRIRPKKGAARDFDPVLAKTANETFFRKAKELGMRFVFGWGTPQDPEWFRIMSDRLLGMGFKSEDFVFKSLIKDEFTKRHIPQLSEARAAVFPDRVKNDWWFQAVYLSVPPPEGATMEDIEAAKLPEFYRMWMCIHGLFGDSVKSADMVRRLRAKGCSVWTYHCSLYMQTKNLLDYHRFYPWKGYLKGLDGVGIWISGTRGGEDGFDSEDGYDDGIAWVGTDMKFVTTKRFEAFREGLEDVAYMDRLKRELDRAAKAGRKHSECERLLAVREEIVKSLDQEKVDAWRKAVGEAIDALSRER